MPVAYTPPGGQPPLPNLEAERAGRLRAGAALQRPQQPGPVAWGLETRQPGAFPMPGTDRMGMPQVPIYGPPPGGWPGWEDGPPEPEEPRPRVKDVQFPTMVPSEEFLTEQAIFPGLPAGTQQTFTPQQILSNELFPAQTGVITAPGQPQIAGVEAQQAAQQQNIQAQQVAFDQSVVQTGIVPPEATVRGQLTQLMADIDSDQAPWADAAIRKVTEVMSARGLGASSITAEAITTAILESALPIAQYDAGAYGEINIQNLRIRQETMLSNTAASNAAKQMNANSVNEVNTFMTGLRDNVVRFNSTQKNAMDQFSAGEVNAANQLYSEMDFNADKFNAENSLLITKSNAEWRRTINTANTAGVNATNMVNASNMFNISQQAMANLWQRSRDVFQWANTSAANERDRALQLTMYAMQRDAYLADRSQAQKDNLWSGIGNFVGDIFKMVLRSQLPAPGG